MAGGGSIQAMINTLRNNKKLLRKKRLFKKERSFLNLKRDYLKVAEGELNLKKATKEDLFKIRKKIKAKKRKEFLIFGIGGLCFVILFGLFVYNVIKDEELTEQMKTVQTNLINEKKFLKHIEDGDKWFRKQNWYNATYFYKKALEINPNNFSVNSKLLRTYEAQCLKEQTTCTKVDSLEKQLLILFPDKKREILENDF